MTPAELKAKWIEELRSGRYDQARHVLHNAGAYCCLGILSLAAGVDPKSYSLFPPDGVTDAARLHNLIRNRLADMNDGTGRYENDAKSFPEIADWIETHDLQTGEPL